jgi:hypothetical protein
LPEPSFMVARTHLGELINNHVATSVSPDLCAGPSRSSTRGSLQRVAGAKLLLRDVLQHVLDHLPRAKHEGARETALLLKHRRIPHDIVGWHLRERDLREREPRRGHRLSFRGGASGVLRTQDKLVLDEVPGHGGVRVDSSTARLLSRSTPAVSPLCSRRIRQAASAVVSPALTSPMKPVYSPSNCPLRWRPSRTRPPSESTTSTWLHVMCCCAGGGAAAMLVLVLT